MIGDIFVLDSVIHLYDMSRANQKPDNPKGVEDLLTFMKWVKGVRGPQSAPFDEPGFDWNRRWQAAEMYDLVFGKSPTDMAVAQTVPLYDALVDWYAPVRTQHDMAAAYPDRVLFCGGVDPGFRGLDDALTQIDHQIKELGAVSMKFYNGHDDVKDCWRCDDRELAYPMYERIMSHGVDVIQFHKGNPRGTQNMEYLSPLDLQSVARDFPEMKLVVHHLALPYFREILSIAARFDNVYLSTAGYTGMAAIAPRTVQKQFGALLQQVGAHKILWGSEAAMAGGPRAFLEMFMEFEIAEDLRRNYGYPQMTIADKRAILGENMADLLKIDIAAKKRELGMLDSVAASVEA